jgi:hypothetical protein
MSGLARGELKLNGIQEVDSSIPFSSTNKIKHFSVPRHRRMFGLSAFCLLLSKVPKPWTFECELQRA